MPTKSLKASSLQIGWLDNNHALSVDLAKLVDTRLLIQGNSGGGKSWLLRLLAERAAGKIQILILDPEGEFATLREKIDIALVGHGGEMATDVRAAALLARKLVELSVSAIVDLYELKLAERRKFVRLFLESLMNVPRGQWHPLLVVLDECHLFCPERSAGEAESTDAVIALMSQGRKRGFAGILSTQRLSKLHKDAAAESNNVVIGRTWLDVDQQRAGDLLGMNKQDRQTLRDLAPGEFYAFGPALNVSGIVRFQSDQVATSHPKAGERHLMDVPQASAAIQEVVQQIGDLPAQAEEEARTLEALTRENNELKRQLRARPVQVEQKVETKIEKVEVPVFQPGQMESLSAAAKALGEASAQLAGISAEIRQALDRGMRLAERPTPRLPSSVVGSIPTRRGSPVVAPAMRASAGLQAPFGGGDADGLTRPQQAILNALATFETLGIEKPHKSNVAVFANQSPSSSGFTNNLGMLRTAGLIEYPGPGRVTLTEPGRVRANATDEIRTLGDLHAAWFSKLARPKVAILQVLIEAYPQPLSKEEVALRAGQSPASSGYTNNLGNLRSLGLIEYPGKGQVRATALLFPNLPQ